MIPKESLTKTSFMFPNFSSQRWWATIPCLVVRCKWLRPIFDENQREVFLESYTSLFQPILMFLTDFFFLFFQLDLLLSGYVNDSSQDAVQLVRELFHEIPSLPKSQNLRIREWRIVLSLLRKTLKVWFFITDGYVEFIPETRISQDFVVFVPNPFNYVLVYLYFIHLKKYWLYSVLCIDMNFECTPTSNLKSMYICVEIQIFSANMIHR